MILIGVYGSLRQGMYNYQHFKSLTKLKELRLPGYKMYSLGRYPCVVKGQPSDSVLIELMKCSIPDFLNITAMELYAGYKLTELKQDDKSFYIYEYMAEPFGAEFVESGDWVEYLKMQNGGHVRTRKNEIIT